MAREKHEKKAMSKIITNINYVLVGMPKSKLNSETAFENRWQGAKGPKYLLHRLTLDTLDYCPLFYRQCEWLVPSVYGFHRNRKK